MIGVRNEALKAKDLSCQKRGLINWVFIDQLNVHSALQHEIEVFGYLGTLHDLLVDIEGADLPQFTANQVQHWLWNILKERIDLEDAHEVGFFPLWGGKVEL